MTDQTHAALLAALAKLEEAQNLISVSWNDDKTIRTPRMAETSNLLDRATRKLKSEIDKKD